MQGIYVYLLKSAITSGILFGYYWFVLRNKNFHFYNRFYLIGTMVLSLVLPLLDLNWFTIEDPQDIPVRNIAAFIDRPGSMVLGSDAITWEKIFFFGMMFISCLFIMIFIVGVFKIYQIKNNSKVIPLSDFDFIETDHEDAPFSFFKNLFWRKDLLLHDDQEKNLLRHEMVHINEKHSWDKVFIELLCALFWMNPIYWFIKRELEVIHEFIADEKTIENADPSVLAAMLLESQYKGKFLNTGESYFYSSIKRRIIMITNSKNPSYSYLRRLLALPIATGLIVLSSFTIKKFNQGIVEKKGKLIPEHIVVLNDTTPKSHTVSRKAKKSTKGSIDGVYLLADTALTYQNKKFSVSPVLVINESSSGGKSSVLKTNIEFSKSENTNTGQWDGVVNTMGDTMETNHKTLKVIFENGISTTTTSDVSFVKNSLEQNNVMKIEVEEKNGNKEYKIVQKMNSGNNNMMKLEVGQHYIKNQENIAVLSPSEIKLNKVKKFIADGKEITQKQMNEIDMNDIQSIKVWNGAEATKRYGKGFEDGVLELFLKKK